VNDNNQYKSVSPRALEKLYQDG
jgi:hypothetical protein